MKKLLSTLVVFGGISLCIPISAQDSEMPDVELRHHRHKDDCGCKKRRHSHERGRRGPTGPTGPIGATGSNGTTGAIGERPSFGFFYSTTGQIIGPGDAIFFENQGVAATGPAFTFTPAPGPSGESFQILQTGYYAINYGMVVTSGVAGIEDIGLGLVLNNITTIPNSLYYPLDYMHGDGFMPAFAGIFHVSSTGSLKLANIGTESFTITPPASFTGPTPVNTSAYISLQFLSPD
jgi:hypothetical protein